MDSQELKQYAIQGIRARLDALDAERAQLLATLRDIEGRKPTTPTKITRPSGRRKRTMSAAGRAAIAKAQKERWARQRRIQDVAPVAEPATEPVTDPAATKTTRKTTKRTAKKAEAPKRTARKVRSTKATKAAKPPMPRLVKARRTADDVPF